MIIKSRLLAVNYGKIWKNFVRALKIVHNVTLRGILGMGLGTSGGKLDEAQWGSKSHN
jgi:hypothetical protein